MNLKPSQKIYQMLDDFNRTPKKVYNKTILECPDYYLGQ